MLYFFIILLVIESNSFAKDFSDKKKYLKYKVVKDVALHSKEISYVAKRLAQAQSICDNHKEGCQSLNKTIPKIGLAVQGVGGESAVVSALVSKALKDQGIFDLLSYVSASSSATWFLASWVMHYNQDLEEFLPIFIHKITQVFPQISISLFSGIAVKLIKKYFSGQPITIIDFWGYILSSLFFNQDDDEQNFSLHRFDEKINYTYMPYPLFTMSVVNTFSYNIMIASMHNVVLLEEQKEIEATLFGSSFNQGYCYSVTPQVSLSYLIGASSAFFSLTCKDIIDFLYVKMSQLLKRNITYDTILYSFFQWRFAPAFVHNFLYGIEGSSYAVDKYMVLADSYLTPEASLISLLGKCSLIIVVNPLRLEQSVDGFVNYVNRYAQRHNIFFTHNVNASIENDIIVLEDKVQSVKIIYINFDLKTSMFNILIQNESIKTIEEIIRDKIKIMSNSFFKELI